MPRSLFVLVFGGALALWLVPDFARACDPLTNTPHVLDPAMQGTDSQAPVLSPIGEVTISRGHEPDVRGCFGGGVICGEDTGSIQILVESTDDMTPADRIGLRVMVVDGTPPAGFVAPGPIRAGGFLFLPWIDGATGDQEPFDMTLSVVAIDLAGNESPPQTVRVQHPGDGGGCRIGGRRSSSLATITVALVAITIASYRRRRGGR